MKRMIYCFEVPKKRCESRHGLQPDNIQSIPTREGGNLHFDQDLDPDRDLDLDINNINIKINMNINKHIHIHI